MVIGTLAFYALPAEAALVTIEIEAVVDYVEDKGPGDGYLEGKISPGDIITGTYTYDSDTPDSNPSATVGRYEHSTPPYGIFLSVSGLDFKTDTSNVGFSVVIVNDSTTGGLHDAYGLRSYNNLPLSSGVNVDIILWWLEDNSASALSSTDLTATAPVLEDWQGNRLCVEALRAFSIDAHVTSAIPEPATIALLGLGGLMLRAGTKK